MSPSRNGFCFLFSCVSEESALNVSSCACTCVAWSGRFLAFLRTSFSEFLCRPDFHPHELCTETSLETPSFPWKMKWHIYLFKDHPEGDIKTCSINYLPGDWWKNWGTKVDHPTTNGQQRYLSSGLPVARNAQLLVSFGLFGNHTSIRVVRHGPMTNDWEIVENAWEWNQPRHGFSGLVWFVWIPLKQTPHRGQDISSLPTKADPVHCDPSRPGCLCLQSRRGQIYHPACNGSRALSLFNGLEFPKATRLGG